MSVFLGCGCGGGCGPVPGFCYRLSTQTRLDPSPSALLSSASVLMPELSAEAGNCRLRWVLDLMLANRANGVVVCGDLSLGRDASIVLAVGSDSLVTDNDICTMVLVFV